MLDPSTGEIIQSIKGLGIPVSAAPFGDYFAVAQHSDSAVSLFNKDGSFHSVLSDDFDGHQSHRSTLNGKNHLC